MTTGSLAGDSAVDAGARVAEVRLLDVSHGGDLVGAAQWPFEHYQRDSVPLRGFTLGPGGEAELLFVVDVARTGAWYWPQTLLEYESGGKQHRIRTNTGFGICPSSQETCEPPN